MMKLGMLALENILDSFNIFLSKIIDKDLLYSLDTSNHQIIKDYKVLWADLGDNISQAYAGTLAVTSTMTKKGYNNIFNKAEH